MSKPRAYRVKAYSATAADSPLAPATIDRREPTENDVKIDILYCGVCHSDLHFARNEWGFTEFPAVPGHEIVGRVVEVGAKVTKFKVGDLAGVGCMVGADLSCPHCQAGNEQFSPTQVQTYAGTEPVIGGPTFGGYSQNIVVQDHFALKLPENLDLAAVAPLLCAGVTTYAPLRHWKVGPGQKVGIVGLGGLGHMGVKFARAFGAHVVVFTTSPSKKEDALRLGAHEVILSKDPEQMKAHAGTFNFILDCVAAEHDLNAYLAMLAPDGVMTLVGAPEKPMPVLSFSLIMGRKSLAGSIIGSIAETQEMLDFCGEHGITSDIEMIRMDQINEAYERMLKSDVKYRFVIDMASLQ
ncbi:NAD(P)-dependent alcohol dehydrogenase [Actomonas aquatica]|uniref:NAD(P)-dependent alcohol dehydrogenase n=1 Tax=Actomonas aquatica TaxID=2866162 RepID=A0ABZ1C6Q1_9BACT|nr:NAD(P)-dependent alcohol dehydrogenase [Opitutus sp. WL0086]WRQ85995.1 NAD(P)-dependent alcohol dehydrogenase [Opitutus sp. WL0086]